MIWTLVIVLAAAAAVWIGIVLERDNFKTKYDGWFVSFEDMSELHVLKDDYWAGRISRREFKRRVAEIETV